MAYCSANYFRALKFRAKGGGVIWCLRTSKNTSFERLFVFLLCSSSPPCIKYFPFFIVIDFNLIPCPESHQRLIYYSQVTSTSILVVILPDKGEKKHSILIFQKERKEHRPQSNQLLEVSVFFSYRSN